jgi:putative nucleotidyltransferase with HDIG domain
MLDENNLLKMAAYSGQAANKIYPISPSLENSHMGLALLEERIISVQDETDILFSDLYLENLLNQVGAVYYFPLYNRENRFGVLTVIATSPMESDKIRLLKSLSENASTAIEKATLFERLRNNYLMTIEALSNALEEKVFNYKNHTKRVAEFSKLIAERFYLSKKDLDDIYISGLLHDIGKLGIADDILNHEDLLNEDEEAMMRAHVEIGKRIIDPIGLNAQIVDGIYLHHKNFDLSGYPENVALERLPLFARIIGVADAFDSELIEARVNSDWKLELVFNQLEVHKETYYCPEVLAALWELIQDNRERVIQISEI